MSEQRYHNALAEVAEASRWFRRRHPRMADAMNQAYYTLDALAVERDRFAAKLEDIATREWLDEGGRIAAAIARDALTDFDDRPTAHQQGRGE